MASVEAPHEPSTTKIDKKWNNVAARRQFPHGSTACNEAIAIRQALRLCKRHTVQKPQWHSLNMSGNTCNRAVGSQKCDAGTNAHHESLPP